MAPANYIRYLRHVNTTAIWRDWRRIVQNREPPPPHATRLRRREDADARTGHRGQAVSKVGRRALQLNQRTPMTRTFHVYPADGGWVVQKEGKSAETFPTQRKAVEAARRIVKDKTAGQLVIHGRDGRIREHETHGMTRIQDPPKKSRLAKRIGRAVGRVALKRVQSDPYLPRDHSSKR